jgi:hypothetical protein
MDVASIRVACCNNFASSKECRMSVTIESLSTMLSGGGIRHHVDGEEQVIRVALVTGRYRNLRAERLAILQIAVADSGERCRVSLERAFAADRDQAATCLTLCRAITAVPLVRVECGPTGHALCLAAELAIEDAAISPRQLFALIDRVVEAAEVGQAAIAADPGSRRAAARRPAA